MEGLKLFQNTIINLSLISSLIYLLLFFFSDFIYKANPERPDHLFNADGIRSVRLWHLQKNLHSSMHVALNLNTFF